MVSSQTKLVIATSNIVYEYEDNECRFVLTREHSYNKVAQSDKGIRFKYVITSRYETRDYTIWTCAELPEIGKWSVIAHRGGDIKNDKSPLFSLRCEKYNDGSILTHEYNLWFGEDIIHDPSCSDYEIYKWGFNHWGNRPSTDNLSQIRFSKKVLYNYAGKNSNLEIILVRDVQNNYDSRYKYRFDDLYISVVRHHGDIYYDSILAYVVPRIYFIKLEADSIQYSPPDGPDKLRFTIIAQHALSTDGKFWEYRRLEIFKESGYSSHITINDLGPVPRSEWEPDWPDPATTPLWVEEESE